MQLENFNYYIFTVLFCQANATSFSCWFSGLINFCLDFNRQQPLGHKGVNYFKQIKYYCVAVLWYRNYLDGICTTTILLSHGRISKK